jgi:hypothetical protein
MQHQRKLAESIAAIQGDLTAYQNNNPSADREAVLKDMKDQNTQIKLEEMPLRMERNLRGDALNRSEYWADTFDRWAEELAGPGSGGGGGGGGGGGEEKDKLPPAILLEIMRIIGDEIDCSLSKQQQSSDWGGPVLSDAQRDYAASDVRYLHRLQAELTVRLEREGRMQIAQACFDFLPTRALLDLAGWPEADIFAHA